MKEDGEKINNSKIKENPKTNNQSGFKQNNSTKNKQLSPNPQDNKKTNNLNETKPPEKNTLLLDYQFIGKKTDLIKDIISAIPKEFFPTQKTLFIFISIFLLVILWGVMLSLEPLRNLSFDFKDENNIFELNMDIGWPLTFFGLTEDASNIQIKFFNLFLDIIVYLILAYIIDVTINFILTIKLAPSEEELKQKPKVLKFKEKTLTDKASEKVIQTVEKQKKKTQNTNQTQNPENQKNTTKITSTQNKINSAQNNKNNPNTTKQQK